MKPTEFVFDNIEALSQSIAKKVATSLQQALANHEAASLVVSGGKTPIPFFKQLSQENLDWSKVWITLADERWVDSDHPDSNEALVRQYLLQNQASKANFIGLKTSAPASSLGELECEEHLKKIPQPFNVLILGMGDDGHTASLFPQAPQLEAALNIESSKSCIAVDPITAPHPRMSLTLKSLLNSQEIILMLTGSKYDVYSKALIPGPVKEFPIRAIIHQSKVPVSVYCSKQ